MLRLTGNPKVDEVLEYLDRRIQERKAETQEVSSSYGESASDALFRMAKEKMEKDPKLSYRQAIEAVQKENPKLANEVLAEIRPARKSTKRQWETM